MDNIQLGSLLINGRLVMYMTFGVIGWFVLHFRLRHIPEQGDFTSYASNAFLIWLLVWKGSFMFLYPTEFIQTPISLLYFDGGKRGMWLASLLAIVYLWIRSRKQNLSVKIWMDVGLWFISGCWLIYPILQVIAGHQPVLYDKLSALWSGGVMLILFLTRKTSRFGDRSGYAIWFLIGHVVLQFLLPDRTLWLLSFSRLQIICIVIAAALTVWSYFQEKKEKG
ncbi:hypothetical protein A8L34_02610 [Bacillus sp. FJAT-27264]|uniref:hypothetical protein n=1 Tax=Paenibacillus sp. (strain DSM 101736 / FJAT-27264) TaxID=1850362 RepID=UPI000807E348|nr:hypothetical protein [Bacillus sp. FJAT-27264]OBZ18493.1 hypothetical protein A8L34_02610 [Bacillus sp. FJAT-27264]